MRIIILFFMFLSVVFASEVKFSSWESGETLLTYLDKHDIHNKIYFDLDKEGRELCSEITADTQFQEQFSDDGKLEQVLIPISEEMQIHLYVKDNEFQIEFIPIIVTEISQTFTIGITNSVHQDIYDATKNMLLANEVSRAFRKTIDFRKLRKNDDVAVMYSQKIRLGKYFGTPDVKAALVEIRKKKNYIFRYDGDSRFYDEKGRSLVSFFMKVPVQYTRISDRFTNKRWHPILKRYRAHLGIDYAAPTGRKIYAAADGKIIVKGTKGGYGKTIEISHKNGYKSLYGHMHRYANVKRGQYVKQGTLIGYVGSTGMSTGPHLHFGLYKNGKAIDPDKIITVTKEQLRGKNLTEFKKETSIYKSEILRSIEKRNTPFSIESFDSKSSIKIN